MLAKAVSGIAVNLDDYRESLAADERYKPWIDFYVNQDEKKYIQTTSPDELWKNLVAQSEAIWPAFLEKIASYKEIGKPVIFECVNLLPHLAHRDLTFPGMVLTGRSYEEILERNRKEPRWSNDSKLQELESNMFFAVERPRYESEAKKYSYPVFETADEAFEPALELLRDQINR